MSRISSDDAGYAHEVFETCRTTGFFLLELGGEEIGDNLIKEIDAMFDISNDVFDLEVEEKIEYAEDYSRGKLTGCVTSPPVNTEFSIRIDKQIAKGV